MFGKVSEDSFQNIFDLSFDSDDKCLGNNGPRNFDFLAGLSSSPLSSFMSNNKDENDLNLFSNKIWNSGFLDTPQEDLEQAFAKLYNKQKEADLSQDKDLFASSFFPFSLSSSDDGKPSLLDLIDETYSKKSLSPFSLAVGNKNIGSSANSTCSTGSSSGLSSPICSSGSLSAAKVNASRYKTELCRPYQENGSCKYGEKCQFAHGLPELRSVNRHPKYKTDLCRTYHSIGFCPYGPRCHFIHSMEEFVSGTSTTAPRGGPKPNPSTTDIAAAIATLRQLPALNNAERSVPPPPGFNKNAESIGPCGSSSPDAAQGIYDESKARLSVFSRIISN